MSCAAGQQQDVTQRWIVAAQVGPDVFCWLCRPTIIAANIHQPAGVVTVQHATKVSLAASLTLLKKA